MNQLFVLLYEVFKFINFIIKKINDKFIFN